MMQRFLIISILGVLMTWSMTTTAEDKSWHSPRWQSTRAAVPVGFDDFLVFMATGKIDLANNDTGLDNCAGGFCLDNHFHEFIMQLDVSEVAYQEALAKQFFLERFGIDIDSEVARGRIVFSQWTADPRAEYRNYVASGRRVTRNGWQVFDGGWLVRIVDPAGFMLGGEFAGLHVVAGAQALFGNYHIIETNKRGRVRRARDIHYRAGSFFQANALSETQAVCELSRSGPEFPNGIEGMAFISAKLYFQTPTVVKVALRNTLTFGESEPIWGLGARP